MTEDHAYTRPRCPECRSRRTRVYDSRPIGKFYRKRLLVCKECGTKFKKLMRD